MGSLCYSISGKGDIKMKLKTKKRLMSTSFVSMMVLGQIQPILAIDTKTGNTITINEIESNDDVTGTDWIEIYNAGTTDVDISNWFVVDDKGLDRLKEKEEWRIEQGTILKAGEVLVIEQDTARNQFSLGKNDEVILYDASNTIKDSYSYTGHASGTLARVPDGIGSFVDMQPTKGELNIATGEALPKHNLVLNEINSSPDDWVEFINLGTETMDLTDYEIRDDANDHRFRFAAGTTVEAGGLIVVEGDTAGYIFNDQTNSYVAGTFKESIGLGSADKVRLYDKFGTILDEYQWSQHASYEGNAALATYGRYPDGIGSFGLTKVTKGTANDWYKPEIVINEIESNDDETDWVEIYNKGNTPVDISGWYLFDDDPVGHAKDVKPVEQGTILNAGEFFVFDGNKHFAFGLGKADKASIYNKDGAIVAEYSWTEHASGVYARIPDGIGEFVDFATSTKGKANILVNPVVINEIQSNDPDKGLDWIELANPTNEELNVSGLIIKDSDDAHEYVIPSGTKISANGFLVIKENTLGFGLGSKDEVQIIEKGRIISRVSWNTHITPTYGLYPDVNGKEYKATSEATPGAINKFADIPEVMNWPGDKNVTIFDTVPTFLSDSSGLDFHENQLYAIDNGTGKFWVLDVAKDGTLTFAKGFENGKRIRFKKDADNPKAAGPDTEGITVDGAGFVYAASERDNEAKGVNYNTILMVDPNVQSEDLVTLKEWDITSSLPQVSANMGIESVEWVSNKNVNGKLFDNHTNAVFDANKYPNAVADGVFFVALEDNGHVYAYVLNDDGTSVQIADINSKLGGAMALDYDTYENVLWVAADNGYKNKAAKISLDGTQEPDIKHVLPAAGVDVNANNEGFAIASAEYTINGQRPVYRFKDGETSGSLSIGSLSCDYTNENNTPPVTPPFDSNQPSNENTTNDTVINAGANTNNASVNTGDITNKVSLFGILGLSLTGALYALKKKHNQSKS